MGQWFEDRLASLNQLHAYQFTYDLTSANVRVKLDANENWHIPTQRLQPIVANALQKADVRKYPLGDIQKLRTAIAKRLQVPEESIIPTAGGDQGIDLVCQGFLREGDRAVIVGPTYSFYKLRSTLAGARCVDVSMNEDFTLPIERILEAAGKGGIVFICSPNNPTGSQFRAEDLQKLCERFRGFVVIDEAYVHFAPETILEQVTHYRNLVVLRTFSKAFALADLRLGLIIGNPEWGQRFLDRVQYPYPVSGLSVNIVLSLLDDYGLVEEGIASLKHERDWLYQELAKFEEVKASPSAANFLLLSLPTDYERVHGELLKKGVATKPVGRVLGLGNCIRVTIGTREMNETLLGALGEVLRNA